MSEWFFTSDLHGQGALYEQLMAIAAAHRPRVVVIGGDLCPHAAGEAGLGHQRVFLQGLLVEFARRLREAVPGGELLLLMGNDDWSCNDDCLEMHEGELWRVLHGRAVAVDGVRVAGLSWVPITPFGIKDWERWEDGAEESPPRLDGWVSRGGRLEPHRFDPAHRAPTIAEALADLCERVRPAETLFVLHSPPRETRCDMVGARARGLPCDPELRRALPAAAGPERPHPRVAARLGLVSRPHREHGGRESRPVRDLAAVRRVVRPARGPGDAAAHGPWLTAAGGRPARCRSAAVVGTPPPALRGRSGPRRLWRGSGGC